MRIFATLMVLALPLVGCAGSPVGDALAGPEKLAERDDAYCRSIGAHGDAYTNCRLFATQQRNASHAARYNAIANMPITPMVTPAPSRQPVTCSTMGNTTTCY